MKRLAFNSIVVFSLACLAVLLCGYVGRFGPFIRWQTTANSVLMDRIFSLSLEEGRFAARYMALGAPLASQGVRTPEIGWDQRFWPPRAPPLSRSVWEFDAHRVFLTPRSGVSSFSIFAFPIWCLALPCLVFPMLWLRRRAAKKPVRGFERFNPYGD